MKKLLVLMVFPVLMVAQNATVSDILKRNMNMGNTTSRIDSLAYSSATVDTTISYNTMDWTSFQLTIKSYDSISVNVYALLSTDNKVFGSRISAGDSLSTVGYGAQTGTIVLGRDISALCKLAPYVKLLLS